MVFESTAPNRTGRLDGLDVVAGLADVAGVRAAAVDGGARP